MAESFTTKLTGGDKLAAALKEMAEKVKNPGTLSVGFQDGSTDEKGVSNAFKAAMNEYGGQMSDYGTATTHYKAPTPPRPFFRTMVAEKSGTWAGDIEKLLKANDYDATVTLDYMGDKIKGQLVDSIFNGGWVPNKPSTLKRKAGTQPLVDTGAMSNSVTWVVK